MLFRIPFLTFKTRKRVQLEAGEPALVPKNDVMTYYTYWKCPEWSTRSILDQMRPFGEKKERNSRNKQFFAV